MIMIAPKRSGDEVNYLHSYADMLAGDTITDSVLTLAEDDTSGVTLDREGRDDSTVSFWLAGGTPGSLVKIDNIITTATNCTFTERFQTEIAT